MTTSDQGLFRMQRVRAIVAEEAKRCGYHEAATLKAAEARILADPELAEMTARAGLVAMLEDDLREVDAVEEAPGVWAMPKPPVPPAE